MRRERLSDFARIEMQCVPDWHHKWITRSTK